MRLKDRLAEIEQERHLSEKPPEVMGVAVILPPPQELVASVEGMESDPEIERIAIEVAKQYEIEPGPQAGLGRGGELRLGLDLAARRPGGPVHRGQGAGRRRRRGPDPNEWIKAQRFGKDYWLYVVVNCKTKPELHLIQDPASKLTPKEEVSVVRYMIGLNDWKRASSE